MEEVEIRSCMLCEYDNIKLTKRCNTCDNFYTCDPCYIKWRKRGFVTCPYDGIVVVNADQVLSELMVQVDDLYIRFVDDMEKRCLLSTWVYYQGGYPYYLVTFKDDIIKPYLKAVAMCDKVPLNKYYKSPRCQYSPYSVIITRLPGEIFRGTSEALKVGKENQVFYAIRVGDDVVTVELVSV